VAVGSSVRTSHWAFRCRGLYLARGWETELSSRSKPLVERSASRKCVHESWLSISPTRPIVSAVLFGSSVWRKAAKGDRARRVSAVRRLLPPPSTVEHKPVMLASIRWVDVAGRSFRRTWMAHWRRQYVEVLPLVRTQPEILPPPRPPRAIRSHHRWSWQDRLACNAWSGPPQWRITLGFRSCLSRRQLTEGGSGKPRDDFNHVPSPSERITRAGVICLLTAPLL
jgi:hypothetical protein